MNIEFPKTLHQWEKNSNYWDAAYKSLNPAVGPASTYTSSERNSLSSPVAPSTTVNTSTCLRKDVAPEEKDGEGFFANCINFSDLPDSDGN